MEVDDLIRIGIKLLKWAVAPILVLLLLVWIASGLFVNHIDNYELGYKFDRRTGEISIIPHAGYVITPPILVKVHTVDLRPTQVCINANRRVLNCKLVRFNPEGLRLFLEWHGRGDYPAFTLDPILESYAYEGTGRTYPFLTVITEIRPSVIVSNNVDSSGVVPTPTTPVKQPAMIPSAGQ